MSTLCTSSPKEYVASPRQLANPPLREALIDILHVNELPVAFVEKIGDLSIPGFKPKIPITTGMFEIKLGPPAEATKKKEDPVGWRFESEDGSRVAQIRQNGLTYSILKGYTTWNEIRDATRQIWDLYLNKISDSVTVGRTAARYINVLEFPGPIELNDYLTAGPRIPENLPQTLDNFIQRILVRYNQDIQVAITQTSEPSPNGIVRIILDIDVFSPKTIEGRSSELWTHADTLRAAKNAVFFSSVTELALEKYA